MEYKSLLFPYGKGSKRVSEDVLRDLKLMRVFKNVVSRETRRNILDWYMLPLRRVREIEYRQDVSKDVERMYGVLRDFSSEMEGAVRLLNTAKKIDWEYNRKGWILEASIRYSNGVLLLHDFLKDFEPMSEGFRSFKEHLERYVESEGFVSLFEESKRVKETLSSIEFCLLIEPGRFSVKEYEGEEDYTPDVERIFSKFQDEENCEDYNFEIIETRGMSHIEAKILEFVKKIYPEPFEMLDIFCESFSPFLDVTIMQFYEEIQFYMAYLEYIEPLRESGFPFCYPDLTDGGDIFAEGFYDIALAYERLGGGKVVLNDFELKEGEKMIVVTGPNQGGKTTFARAFGQIHYLASLGLPVPALRARLLVHDGIFTHFEREESVESLKSKLEDDLLRARKMLDSVTARSVVIMNEAFSSATFEDAMELSKKVMEKLLDKGCVGVCVTFLDDLAGFDERVVSMVALVNPKDPSIRTFRVVRREADGMAYAISIAEKYGLTYEKLKERMRA